MSDVQKFYREVIGPGLLPAEKQTLSEHERAWLWKIVVQIGLKWGNVFFDEDFPQDSANVKSSWLEFVETRTTTDPSYAAEYSSAAKVIEELIAEFGEEEAFEKLFFDLEFVYEPPADEDMQARFRQETRLAHAKQYVVDEFIQVQIVAGGFKFFGDKQHRGRNYKGYIGGSRYNRNARVRDYRPATEEAN